jgi:acetoin utilization protein AcuB
VARRKACGEPVRGQLCYERRMSVQSIMTKTVVSASPDATVREAIQLIDDNDIRHLPIVEHGRLIGIVSDRDLRGCERERPDEQLGTALRELMSHEPLCMEAGESIKTLIDVMLEYKIGALPVVGRDGELIGIVSYIDVLQHARALLFPHAHE